MFHTKICTTKRLRRRRTGTERNTVITHEKEKQTKDNAHPTCCSAKHPVDFPLHLCTVKRKPTKRVPPLLMFFVQNGAHWWVLTRLISTQNFSFAAGADIWPPKVGCALLVLHWLFSVALTQCVLLLQGVSWTFWENTQPMVLNPPALTLNPVHPAPKVFFLP